MLPLATFGNLFSRDGLFIFVIMLLLFGAKRLPDLLEGLRARFGDFSDVHLPVDVFLFAVFLIVFGFTLYLHSFS